MLRSFLQRLALLSLPHRSLFLSLSSIAPSISVFCGVPLYLERTSAITSKEGAFECERDLPEIKESTNWSKGGVRRG
jgi:hypothetical protein